MTRLLQFLFKEKYLLLSLFAALLASFPLFHSGLMPTHDGEYHLIRFYEFDKTLRSGVLYPRWAPDLFFGYGIPLLTYVYPLPNYIASIFHFFGASFLDSVKLNMITATLTGSLFFYLWGKKFWGNLGGMVSSIFYTFSPYHFVDMYVRGSVGEVWALGVFPGFLWAFTEFVETKKPIFAVLSSVFLALTIFSHNILGLMFFAFALSYITFLLLIKKQLRKLGAYSVSIVLLSLGISALFWIPALFETKYVAGLQIYDIMHNFPDVSQLLFPSWGTDFFGSGTGSEMSVQIGIMNLLAVFASIGILIFWKKKNKLTISLLLFFLAWFLLSIFLMNQSSYVFWKIIPFIHYFQFPWRFLSLTILICSFLAGSIAMFKKTKLLAWIFAILAVVLTISYTQPAYYMLRSDSYYTTRSNFIDSTNSVGNMFNTIWNTSKNERPKELFTTDQQQKITKIDKQSPTHISAIISVDRNIKQIVSVSYFPSWQVTVDNKKVPTESEKGLLAFSLPKGQHTIAIKLHDTPIEIGATLLSFASIFLLFFLLRKKIL